MNFLKNKVNQFILKTSEYLNNNEGKVALGALITGGAIATNAFGIDLNSTINDFLSTMGKTVTDDTIHSAVQTYGNLLIAMSGAGAGLIAVKGLAEKLNTISNRLLYTQSMEHNNNIYEPSLN